MLIKKESSGGLGSPSVGGVCSSKRASPNSDGYVGPVWGGGGGGQRLSSGIPSERPRIDGHVTCQYG